MQVPNIPHFLIAYFGMLKAGCVGIPVNVLLKAPEVAFTLGDAGARALVTWAGVAEEAMKGADEAGVSAVYVVNTPARPRPRAGGGSRTSCCASRGCSATCAGSSKPTSTRCDVLPTGCLVLDARLRLAQPALADGRRTG